MVAVASGLLASAGPVSAGLFEDVTGVTAPAAARTLSQRVVKVDTGYLKGRLSLTAAAAPVEVELVPGLSAKLNRRTVEIGYGGDLIWTGSPADGSLGSADLVVDGDDVTGLIIYRNGTYAIDPLPGEGGLHVIRKVDGAAFPGDIVWRPSKSQPAEPLVDVSAPSAASTRIDMLVAYTAAAKATTSNIRGRINLAISLANTAFRNSRVPVKYRLVGTIEVSYNEASGFEDALNALTAGKTATFKAVHTLRNSKKADLVQLLIDNPDSCGLAWLGPGDPKYGFGVTNIACIENQSFTHESGHNIGLNHDRYVEASAPNSKYNFGYVNATKRVRDLMAYNNECADQGFDCTRIPFFSTPKVKYRGATIGVAKGKAGAADAARWVTEKRAIVARYR